MLYMYCYTTDRDYGEDMEPANNFNLATLFMYAPVPSQEPAIQ